MELFKVKILANCARISYFAAEEIYILIESEYLIKTYSIDEDRIKWVKEQAEKIGDTANEILKKLKLKNFLSADYQNYAVLPDPFLTEGKTISNMQCVRFQTDSKAIYFAAEKIISITSSEEPIDGLIGPIGRIKYYGEVILEEAKKIIEYADIFGPHDPVPPKGDNPTPINI